LELQALVAVGVVFDLRGSRRVIVILGGARFFVCSVVRRSVLGCVVTRDAIVRLFLSAFHSFFFGAFIRSFFIFFRTDLSTGLLVLI